jgi:three-Cys-motif partner protein
MEGEQLTLFDLPPGNRPEAAIPPIKNPIWTEHKARLIERYLYYFVLITHHGAYIDGFAGPQEEDKPQMWAAKLVLESEPRWLQRFFLCDASESKSKLLQQLKAEQKPPSREKKEPKRSIDVICGDFNSVYRHILDSAPITENQAAFCLLDQRTFECKWSTVSALAQHKAGGRKIELFYFLPVKWLQRALDAQQALDVIANWWGRDDWTALRGMSSNDIKEVVRRRFLEEFGYRYVLPWPIWEKEGGTGSVMYYMVHATDHDEAPNLMARAYRQATGTKEPPEQFLLQLEEWRGQRHR